MKLIKIKDDRYTFGLGRSEKAMLFDLLKLYPSGHPRGARLSRSAESNKPNEAQQLLEDSLAAKKRQNQRKLSALMEENSRFILHESSFNVSLKREEMEWLLQVLNDIRVGCWVALGSPNLESAQNLKLTSENAKSAWAMELAGYFEMALLNALASGH